MCLRAPESASLLRQGTTPLWLPLAVAVIAVVGTLAGVAFTQVWNSRLEGRRWARENDRLREAQAREDLNRNYEHRRAAYVEFLQEFDRLALSHSDLASVAPNNPVYNELIRRSTLIWVYGTDEADNLASICVKKLRLWGLHSGRADLADDVHSAAASYLFQIREDLGVPQWKPAEPPESMPAIDQRK